MIIKKASAKKLYNYLSEAIGHMKDEHTFAPLELASTLEAGMKVYKPNSDDIWTVKSVDNKKYFVDMS